MSSFVALMRRYVNDYTNRQCLQVCDDIMYPEYTLRMGEHVLSGRDEAYKPAAARQFKQFPGLCLTVHNIITNGERLLMHFSEHGASMKHDAACAAWSGIGLYRWDGKRLQENYVEQDYFSRKRQLAKRRPLPVERPALAPWDTVPASVDTELEAWARDTLSVRGLDSIPADAFDDFWANTADPRVLEESRTQIDDLFSAGEFIAFRVTQYGRVSSNFLAATGAAVSGHEEATLYATGWMQVRDGQVIAARVIRDRLGLQRRLCVSA